MTGLFLEIEPYDAGDLATEPAMAEVAVNATNQFVGRG